MILITGGRGQGKLGFARSLAAFEIGGSQIADGETDPFEAAFSRPVIKHFERYIKRGMQNQLDCEAFLRRILSDNPDAVVIADEIGCGIVPVDAFERAYRDEAGRLCQLLAREAGAVYRVNFGIGQQIK